MHEGIGKALSESGLYLCPYGMEVKMADIIMAMVIGMAPEKSAVDAVKGISRNQLIGILESALEISEQQGGRE